MLKVLADATGVVATKKNKGMLGGVWSDGAGASAVVAGAMAYMPHVVSASNNTWTLRGGCTGGTWAAAVVPVGLSGGSKIEISQVVSGVSLVCKVALAVVAYVR